MKRVEEKLAVYRDDLEARQELEERVTQIKVRCNSRRLNLCLELTATTCDCSSFPDQLLKNERCTCLSAFESTEPEFFTFQA